METFPLADPAVRDWFSGAYAPNFTSWRDPQSFSAAFDALTRDFDVVHAPFAADVVNHEFPAGSFRTIGRESEFAGKREASSAARQLAESVAMGRPDFAAIGADTFEAWIKARADLRGERTPDNRASEASRSRRLIDFLKMHRGVFAGQYVASLTRQAIADEPLPAVAEDLLEALRPYEEEAVAPPQRARRSWWPFGRRKS